MKGSNSCLRWRSSEQNNCQPPCLDQLCHSRSIGSIILFFEPSYIKPGFKDQRSLPLSIFILSNRPSNVAYTHLTSFLSSAMRSYTAARNKHASASVPSLPSNHGLPSNVFYSLRLRLDRANAIVYGRCIRHRRGLESTTKSRGKWRAIAPSGIKELLFSRAAAARRKAKERSCW